MWITAILLDAAAATTNSAVHVYVCGSMHTASASPPDKQQQSQIQAFELRRVGLYYCFCLYWSGLVCFYFLLFIGLFFLFYCVLLYDFNNNNKKEETWQNASLPDNL